MTHSRLSLISKLFGDETSEYVANKHRGGTSGQKGTRYEDFFAVVQIAKTARENWNDLSSVSVDSQLEGHFVDDLKITTPSKWTFCQLKNAQTVSWGSDNLKSIADDFRKELHTAKTETTEEIELWLVVSDPTLKQKLENDIPEDLAKHVHVELFPWHEKASAYCSEARDSLKDIVWLSRFDEPNPEELQQVITLLLGLWSAGETHDSLNSVLNAARQLRADMIRSSIEDKKILEGINPEFIAILQRIPNFSYKIVKGFFTWTMVHKNNSYDKGHHPKECASESFEALQQRVIRSSPSTFSELENELL